MTVEERAELIGSGWADVVVDCLALRGFRPCKPDIIAARSGDFDLDGCVGFLRQTRTPHLYITVAKDALPHVVMERIDTAIYECGHRHGHERVASRFMGFFNDCKVWTPSPDLAAIEKRLQALESAKAAS